MKWITRERPKIDRIASPWLIKKFVDKEAEFIYVPFTQVLDKAKELDAINYKKVDTYKEYAKEVNKSNTVVDCPYFTTNFIPLENEKNVVNSGASFVVYMCAEGSFEIDYDGVIYQYKKGDTVLIPATLKSLKINGKASILEIYIS